MKTRLMKINRTGRFAMNHFLIVGLGGALGAMSRAGLSAVVMHRMRADGFPLGTLVVNVVGCALAGLLAGLVVRHDWLTPQVRVFLFTGVLGGFTTFSAFSLETIALMRRGEHWLAGSYVAASVIGGLMILWMMMTLVPRDS